MANMSIGMEPNLPKMTMSKAPDRWDEIEADSSVGDSVGSSKYISRNGRTYWELTSQEDSRRPHHHVIKLTDEEYIHMLIMFVIIFSIQN